MVKELEENFISRLFNIIDLPLFLLLGLVLVQEFFKTNEFYLEYVIYIVIAGFLINTGLYGFSGYRAAKDKSSQIKPWIAGLFTALIVSIFSLFLAVITIVYFPTPLGDLAGLDLESEDEIVQIGEEGFENEEIQTTNEFDSDFANMGQGGWNDPLLSWTLIGGGIGLIFSSLFGALCGLIGGAIGKD